MGSALKDITGQRFGRWTVLEYAGGRKSYWRCLCDCGTVKLVQAYTLRAGISKSCGCWRAEESGRRLSAQWAQRRRGQP